MPKKLSDVTEQEILDFREDIAKIDSSKTMTDEEKSEKIKSKTKNFLKDFSYVDLIDALKNSKLKRKVTKKYWSSYEEAIEELLEEKKKTMSMTEIDSVLEHLQKETSKTRRFIKDTNDSYLSNKS